MPVQDWVGIAETTIRDYFRDVEDDVVRNRKLLALMQSRGRITFNHSGLAMNWKVRYKRGLMKGYGDMDVVTFVRRNRHKSAELGWRAYTLDESVSKWDKLKNRSTEAIVNVIGDKVKTMSDDVDSQFGDKMYLDGNATGNEKEIHGFESMMGTSGVQTAAPVGTPSDTYAEISTTLANYGGSWSLSGANSTWPVGIGSEEYDFYSPLIVSYTNSFWAATTDTWPNTCQEALRYGIFHAQRNSGRKGQIDMILLDRELYRQFAEALAAKEHINIQQGGGKRDTLTSLGFGDVIWFEGVEVTSEYGVPPGVGYGFNIDYMELCSQQANLFESMGPIAHEDDKSFRFSVDFFGNMKFESPRNFVKWAALG